MRQRKNGNRASYIINRYINYSNYCILSCQFCAFARKKRDADGLQFTVEEIVAKSARSAGSSASRNCTSSADCIRRCRSVITRTCCGR